MGIPKIKLISILLLVLFCGVCVLMPGMSLATENTDEESQPLVTATFFDSDIKEALKEVAIQTGVNIAVDEAVKGLVTLEIKEVPLEKALRMMLINGGYSFRRIDDFYLVGLADPRNPVFAGLCESKVYYFQNISAESAKALLPTFYEPYVKFDTIKDSANIVASPEIVAQIIDDFKKMDGERKQIRIKALVTEIRSDVLKEWGIDLLRMGDIVGDYAKSTTLDVTNGAITINGKGDYGYIFGSIKAMVNEKKATIHADPIIVVTEGKTGDLFVGDKRTLILETQGTTGTSSTTQNVEAGTTLKVSPKLLNDQIELTLTQNVSTFDNEERTDQILVRSNEFSSVVRFLPGQTVMIAGITENQTRKNVSKTPILGDIPILRLLFRQKSDQKVDSELLIFISAEIVK